VPCQRYTWRGTKWCFNTGGATSTSLHRNWYRDTINENVTSTNCHLQELESEKTDWRRFEGMLCYWNNPGFRFSLSTFWAPSVFRAAIEMLWNVLKLGKHQCFLVQYCCWINPSIAKIC
jgi:hypothetical protein